MKLNYNALFEIDLSYNIYEPNNLILLRLFRSTLCKVGNEMKV